MSETVTASRLPRTFTKKKINVSFTVASGALGPTPTDDTITLEGFRVRATISNAGQNTGSQLVLIIEGLPLATMNRLSVVSGLNDQQNQTYTNYTASTVTVLAGDDISGMSTVFVGNIAEAFVDFNASPNVRFQVTAFAVLQYQVDKITPTSSPGTVKALTILSNIAAKAGLTVINHGLSKSLTNDYRSGDTITQISGVVKAVGGVFNINSYTNTLYVWPNEGAVDSASTVSISKNNGLIGYPSYNQSGITFRTFFNNGIEYFTPFEIKSEYLPAGWVNNQMGQNVSKLPADGTWRPYMITHDISAEIPDGPWFTDVAAVRTDFADTVSVR